MKQRFRLHTTEYERGWGSKPDVYYFDTLEEAESCKREINDRNKAQSAPDWYEIAEEIEELQVVETWVTVK